MSNNNPDYRMSSELARFTGNPNLLIPINNLSISARVRNALNNLAFPRNEPNRTYLTMQFDRGVMTLTGQLLILGKTAFLRGKNLGPTSLTEVTEALEAIGLDMPNSEYTSCKRPEDFKDPEGERRLRDFFNIPESIPVPSYEEARLKFENEGVINNHRPMP